MRILLVSDLHLDTAFGWAGPALGDVLRANLRATLDRIATLARHSRVDALVCGGDLFDQARATPKTLAHLRTTFAELDISRAPGPRGRRLVRPVEPVPPGRLDAQRARLHRPRAHPGDPGGRTDLVGWRTRLPREHRRVPGRVPRETRRRQPRPVPWLRDRDDRRGRAVRAVPGRAGGGRRARPRAARARPHARRPRPVHLPRQPLPAHARRDRTARGRPRHRRPRRLGGTDPLRRRGRPGARGHRRRHRHHPRGRGARAGRGRGRRPRRRRPGHR